MINTNKETNVDTRILSVDLARGLAVFFMIAVHTLQVYANPEVTSSLLGKIISFLGGPPAAPVFMTLMGFSFVYSKKSALKSKLVRGLKVFLSGYILNLLRGVIPYKLSIYFETDLAKSLPLDRLNDYTIFTIVDILQFAGIALIIIAILQELKVNRYKILLLAFIIILISPFLWGIRLNIPFVDDFLDLLWGDQVIQFKFIDNKIAFPVFPWLAFPLLGMFLGETLKSSNDQKITFKYFGFSGLIVLLIGVFISSFDLAYHANDYYHSRQGAMIFMCGFVLVWLFVNNLIIDSIPMNGLFTLLFKWSNGVTNIYFVQWIVILWSIAFFGIGSSSYISVISLILAFTLISHFANELYKFLLDLGKKT
jgi:uncharacterized membrane protein